MAEAKHTPGPWRLKTTGNFGNVVEARAGSWDDGSERWSHVAHFQTCLPRGLYTHDQEEENAAANGALLAAAPDLLDALRHLRSVMGAYKGTPEEILALDAADKAIAKSEGSAS